jgi:hypothetical protein
LAGACGSRAVARDALVGRPNALPETIAQSGRGRHRADAVGPPR